jgi:hypothetical protein
MFLSDYEISVHKFRCSIILSKSIFEGAFEQLEQLGQLYTLWYSMFFEK